MRTTKAALAVITAISALTLAACGTGTSPDQATITASPGAVPAAAPAPEAMPAAAAPAANPMPAAPVAAQATPVDIVDTAVAAGSFTNLAKALQAAGLVDTLKGAGPFTVFAPSDAAFAKLPPAVLQAVLADKALLTKILTYHVVPGRVLAADIKPGAATTVEGQPLQLAVANGAVTVNGTTNVVTADIAASNGVIHVIDSVLIPGDVTLPTGLPATE
jgi:uncharacterized surface protein with fasciclin (FAS1) repeats